MRVGSAMAVIANARAFLSNRPQETMVACVTRATWLFCSPFMRTWTPGDDGGGALISALVQHPKSGFIYAAISSHFVADLPAGLALDSATGAITGTPAISGTFGTGPGAAIT